MNWMPKPEVRRWIYGIAVVAMPLLVFYGILDESAAPLWIAAAGGILVPGMAALNTNTGGDSSDDQG